MSLPNPSMSFTPFDPLPASDLNDLVENDQALASGSGTNTGVTFNRPRITTSIDDTNGNEIIKTPATASAVNEITVTNAATANAPKISATGGDTNIDLELIAKGTGKVKLPSTNKTTDANGWTLYDYGAWKEYVKTQSGTSASVPANSGVALVTMNLPTGFGSRTGYLTLHSNYVANQEININLTSNTAAASMAFRIYNSSGGALAPAYELAVKLTQL